MTKIVWTDPAIADLEAINDFIGRDSALYAAAMVERIILAVDQLEQFPRAGRAVPEARSASVRELIVASYRVIYRVKNDRVDILGVVHGARRLRSGRPPRRRSR